MFRIDWVNEPDKLALAKELLGGLTRQSETALLSEKGQVFGAGSVENTGEAVKLRVFVAPERRNEGFGDVLLRTLLLRAVSKDTRKLLLFVPEEYASWPLELGFSETGRAEGGFAELSAYPEDIELGGCC